MYENTIKTNCVSMISNVPWETPGTSQGPSRDLQETPRSSKTSQLIPRDPQGPTRYAQAHQRMFKDPAKTTNAKPPASKP